MGRSVKIPVLNRYLTILVLLGASSLFLAGQKTFNVEVKSFTFTPDALTVHVGDTVLWINTGGIHNVDGKQSVFPGNPESFGNETGSGWEYWHVFTLPGDYDYRCDPHVSLGMVGHITVLDIPPDTLTVNFSGMGPHVGQTGWIIIKDDETGEIVERGSDTIEESFSIKVPGIQAGHNYTVDIYADFNGNGYYDAPPVDHAWRYKVEGVSGNVELEVAHNLNFTDIEWAHMLHIHFTGMTPHLGQKLTLFVRDLTSGTYLDTVVVESIEAEDFDVRSYVIEPFGSYMVDLYVDFNGNGMYDPPPTDHAWRIETGMTMGDLDVDFMHNTDFTDILNATGNRLFSEDPGISYYPNPATDLLFVDSQTGIESVTIYSVIGSRLKTTNHNGVYSAVVSLSKIQSGTYFLGIRTTDRKLWTYRLVIE